ncbi:MAG: DUF4097 family beta strand repeat-containing protein [Candidatus Zixiibacteriota bacterium]
MKTLSLAIGLILLASTRVLADYSEIKKMEISTDQIRLFKVDCGAGSLEIEGVEGMDKIEVKAEIYIDNMNDREAREYMDDHMTLDIKERGKVASLKSTFENNNFSFGFFSNSISAEINLKIKMPKNIELEIDDGSGFIDIKNIDADLEIDDGSGDLYLENITGRVIINDGSGEVEMVHIVGPVDIDDGSGEITAEDISGDMVIEDGSGEIRISAVIGNVDINDGSGSIRVENVDGSVAVDDGSGNIRINDITHDVDIINDTSGRVSIANVDGDVYR